MHLVLLTGYVLVVVAIALFMRRFIDAIG